MISEPKLYEVLVREFMVAFEQPCYEQIENVPIDTIKLRARLIEEESAEYHREQERGTEELDGLCDLMYVVIGLNLVGNVDVHNYRSGQTRVVSCPKLPLHEPVLNLTQELWTLFPCPRRTNGATNKLIAQIIDTARMRGYDLRGAFQAVHNNNMAKLWSEPTANPELVVKRKGSKWLVKDAGGKVVKPLGHKKVDLGRFVL